MLAANNLDYAFAADAYLHRGAHRRQRLNHMAESRLRALMPSGP